MSAKKLSADLRTLVATMRDLGVSKIATNGKEITGAELGTPPPAPPRKRTQEEADEWAKYYRALKKWEEGMAFAHTEGFPDPPEMPQ